MEIILLHGALSTSSQLIPLERELQRFAKTHRFDFPGHGRVAKVPFTMDALISYLKTYIEENCDEDICIFGYSMGGYAALSYAAGNKVGKVITLGTKLHWSPESAESEIRMLQPEKIVSKVPAFASSLEKLHGSNWPELVNYTADMMKDLGSLPVLTEKVYREISASVLLMRGTADMMVTEEETRSAASMIPGARFEFLEGVPHPIEKVDPLMLAEKIKRFLEA